MAQLDFTRQTALKVGKLIKKVEELEKRVTELERDSSGTREVSEVPKRGPGRPKKTDIA